MRRHRRCNNISKYQYFWCIMYNKVILVINIYRSLILKFTNICNNADIIVHLFALAIRENWLKHNSMTVYQRFWFSQRIFEKQIWKYHDFRELNWLTTSLPNSNNVASKSKESILIYLIGWYDQQRSLLNNQGQY